jgi:CRP-like cAMP-binding protein
MDYQDTTNDVFFIVSGTVRVKLQLVSGREVLLREINAGEFFGELAAIDNQPRSSGIVAVTDVIAARMPASVFRAAVHLPCTGVIRESVAAATAELPVGQQIRPSRVCGIFFV